MRALIRASTRPAPGTGPARPISPASITKGGKTLPARYDDGGLSGGTPERPALRRLLPDIDAGRVGMVVVCRTDRLTRSPADFARPVDRLAAAGRSLVSVTQALNTSSSMGRLTLSVLLSFARFGRGVTAGRIRDRIAASKRKGLWTGGVWPRSAATRIPTPNGGNPSSTAPRPKPCDGCSGSIPTMAV